jgi:hypothetical protein
VISGRQKALRFGGLPLEEHQKLTERRSAQVFGRRHLVAWISGVMMVDAQHGFVIGDLAFDKHRGRLRQQERGYRLAVAARLQDLLRRVSRLRRAAPVSPSRIHLRARRVGQDALHLAHLGVWSAENELPFLIDQQRLPLRHNAATTSALRTLTEFVSVRRAWAIA